MPGHEIPRQRLMVLLNALYDAGTETITVAHPGAEVGELCRLHLGDEGGCTVEVTLDERGYAESRDAVNSAHGEPAITELPDQRSYLAAYLAAGLLEPGNADAIEDFLETHGAPDLTAGHPPVMAGFDTNLLAWRPAAMLGLEAGAEAVVNGFALATGVRDELRWDQKRKDTQSLEEAFDGRFDALWNQPAGPQRQGRLGETRYRQLRDRRLADELESDRSDEAIVAAYDEYQDEQGADVLLFSNDRDFIERARSHRIRAQRVEFPETLPAELEGSWEEARDLLYVLAVLFGILDVPKTTLYGVWQGKGGQAWHEEALQVDVRSPPIEEAVERDLAILRAYHGE